MKEAAQTRKESDPGPPEGLIVCDRGFFDNCAYMTGDEFRQVLGKLNVTEEELLESYDGVFPS